MSITLNSGKTFLITDDSGDIGGSERGFFSSDTRMLCRYVLTIDGETPALLSGEATSYRSAVH
jgi:hypothetical protein